MASSRRYTISNPTLGNMMTSVQGMIPRNWRGQGLGDFMAIQQPRYRRLSERGRELEREAQTRLALAGNQWGILGEGIQDVLGAVLQQQDRKRAQEDRERMISRQNEQDEIAAQERTRRDALEDETRLAQSLKGLSGAELQKRGYRVDEEIPELQPGMVGPPHMVPDLQPGMVGPPQMTQRMVYDDTPSFGFESPVDNRIIPIISAEDELARKVEEAQATQNVMNPLEQVQLKIANRQFARIDDPEWEMVENSYTNEQGDTITYVEFVNKKNIKQREIALNPITGEPLTNMETARQIIAAGNQFWDVNPVTGTVTPTGDTISPLSDPPLDSATRTLTRGNMATGILNAYRRGGSFDMEEAARTLIDLGLSGAELQQEIKGIVNTGRELIIEEERNRFFQTPDGQELLISTSLSPKNIPIPEEVAAKIQERVNAFEDSLYSPQGVGGGVDTPREPTPQELAEERTLDIVDTLQSGDQEAAAQVVEALANDPSYLNAYLENEEWVDEEGNTRRLGGAGGVDDLIDLLIRSLEDSFETETTGRGKGLSRPDKYDQLKRLLEGLRVPSSRVREGKGFRWSFDPNFRY